MEGFFSTKGVTLFLVLFLLSHISPSSAYQKGAPSVACDNLTPQHGAAPQTSPSPYKVTLGKVPLLVNTPLNITLTSKNDRDEFLGFLVQVRREDGQQQSGDKPILQSGQFVNNPHMKDSKTLACSGKPNLAMTHTGNEPKRKVTVRWVPDSPGTYRVHTTFVKSAETYWVNQVDDQIIEVHPSPGHRDPQSPSSNPTPPDMNILCSTMKLNASVEPQIGTESPYTVMVRPVEGDHHQDPHKISQKGQMWINVSSEFDTPILKMFMQVRPQHQQPSKVGSNAEAVGRFISASSGDDQKGSQSASAQVKLVDCFGGKANAILYENRLHAMNKKTSDVSVLWEAPQDQVGDFQAVVTILSEEDTFWDKVGDDPEARKIKVVKTSSKVTTAASGSKEQASSSSAGTNNFGFILSVTAITGKSTSSSFIFGGAIKLFLFFTMTFVLAL